MLLPLLDKGEPNDFEAIMPHLGTPCPHLTNPDLILLLDGSYCKNEKGIFPRLVILLLPNMKRVSSCKSYHSKSRTLCPYQSMSVTRRTDCQHSHWELYAFVVIHDLGMLWKQRACPYIQWGSNKKWTVSKRLSSCYFILWNWCPQN